MKLSLVGTLFLKFLIKTFALNKKTIWSFYDVDFLQDAILLFSLVKKACIEVKGLQAYFRPRTH